MSNIQVGIIYFETLTVPVVWKKVAPVSLRKVQKLLPGEGTEYFLGGGGILRENSGGGFWAKRKLGEGQTFSKKIGGVRNFAQ